MSRRVRARQAKPIAWALDNWLRSKGLKERVDRQRVLLRWEQVVGALTASHAKAVRVEGATLIVQTDSPSWSHTLTMMKSELLACLREFAQNVNDIRFLVGDEPPARNSFRRRPRR